MLFEVILELHAKPDQSSSLEHWLAVNLPDTQTFDGCVSVHALAHEDDPCRIVLIGFWQSRKQWEKYFKWREDRGDFDVLAPMLRNEPRAECFRQFGEWHGGRTAV